LEGSNNPEIAMKWGFNDAAYFDSSVRALSVKKHCVPVQENTIYGG
jgi:hypothetical protein